MFPVFPKFKKLKLNDKKFLESFTLKYPPFSDFNFASLWSYNRKDSIEISTLNNNLVVKFLDYTSHDHFYSFLGKNKPRHTIETLLDYAQSHKIDPVLKMVPESNFSNINALSKIFSIKDDRDNFDYILSIKDICDPESRTHYNKIKQINQFDKAFPNCKTKVIDIHDAKIHSQINKLFNEWKDFKNDPESEPEIEFIAIQRLIRDAKFFKLVSVGIYNKDRLIGFGISEIDHTDYAEFHFAKGDIEYRGVYAVVYKSLADELNKLGYKFMNIEQDLGISGLRTAKEQWHPIKYLKKYIIELKD